MNKLDMQDLALRGLFVAAGVLAAVLLAFKGQAQALPAIAAGGALGALFMRSYGTSEE
jgi:hypothetical protein